MVASIRARLVLVLSTTVFTFVAMAGMAALTTIGRDVLVRPRPVVTDLAVAFTPVHTAQQVTIISKLSFASYRSEYEEQKRRWAAEEEEAAAAATQKKKERAKHPAGSGGLVEVQDDDDFVPVYDEAANDFGHRDGPGFVARANDLLARALVGLVGRLTSLPIVGPLFEGRLGLYGRGDASLQYGGRRADDRLGYPITRSPYIDADTDTIEPNCHEFDAERAARASDFYARHPQLLAFDRTYDEFTLFLSGEVDVRPLWEWNTKAIYVSFLASYTTNKTVANEVVFLDAIVRDVALPWALRHLKGTTAETRSPADEAALQSFLESVRHPVHDAQGVFINHVEKKVTFHNAAKYPVADLYVQTLASAEVKVVMRYQVMSYSGWAPVLELPPAEMGSLVIRPEAAAEY